MLFFWNKKSVSVSVCYSILKIGIGIGNVKIFKIGKNGNDGSKSIVNLAASFSWTHSKQFQQTNPGTARIDDDVDLCKIALRRRLDSKRKEDRDVISEHRASL